MTENPPNIRTIRRDPVAQHLGLVIMRSVDEAAALRAAGADPEAVAAGLEAVVREYWMKPHDGRTAPWRYLCEACNDTGWRYLQCPGDATCGLAKGKPHYAHDYVVPCWCEPGRARVPKQKQPTDELAAVGKTSKPTKWGRT